MLQMGKGSTPAGIGLRNSDIKRVKRAPEGSNAHSSNGRCKEFHERLAKASTLKALSYDFNPILHDHRLILACTLDQSNWIIRC